jgi:hypothetical protein
MSRWDSAYARSLSSLVISARLSHTRLPSGNYLSHGWQAEAPAPQERKVGQAFVCQSGNFDDVSIFTFPEKLR